MSQNAPTADVSNRGGASSVRAEPWAEVTETADVQALSPLPGSPEGVGTQDLAGSGWTYRHDWGNKRGQWTLRLNMGGVGPRTRAFVAIAEGAAGGPDGGKHLGAARYTLHNVVPRAGGVDIWVNIEWGSDIRIYVDYLVINP